MDKRNRVRLVLTVCLGIFALALVAPVAANAQVTIFHIEVVVGSGANAVSYCDTATSCDLPIWNLGGGIPLAATNTLVLTQAAFLPGIGGDFDTSDRVNSTSPFEQQCDGVGLVGLCPVNISIATTNSPITAANLVYTNNGANPIGGFNVDPGNQAHQEGVAYTDVTASLIGAPPFKLGLGYADTVHGNGGTSTLVACTSTTYNAGEGSLCVPSPWDPSHVPSGGSAATRFIGGYMTASQITSVPGAPATINCDSLCLDGGALVITANTVTPGCTTDCVTVTQGGWGAPPHGNNPGAILANNFNTITGGSVSIGCKAGVQYTFDSAMAIQNFLPQGGTPSVLQAPTSTDPTSKNNVFAGQVLALELNVGASASGVFPKGLGALTVNVGTLGPITIDNFLTLANNVLGGCTTAPSAATGGLTISQLNDIADKINNKFDN